MADTAKSVPSKKRHATDIRGDFLEEGDVPIKDQVRRRAGNYVPSAKGKALGLGGIFKDTDAQYENPSQYMQQKILQSGEGAKGVNAFLPKNIKDAIKRQDFDPAAKKAVDDYYSMREGEVGKRAKAVDQLRASRAIFETPQSSGEDKTVAQRPIPKPRLPIPPAPRARPEPSLAATNTSAQEAIDSSYRALRKGPPAEVGAPEDTSMRKIVLPERPQIASRLSSGPRKPVNVNDLPPLNAEQKARIQQMMQDWKNGRSPYVDPHDDLPPARKPPASHPPTMSEPIRAEGSEDPAFNRRSFVPPKYNPAADSLPPTRPNTLVEPSAPPARAAGNPKANVKPSAATGSGAPGEVPKLPDETMSQYARRIMKMYSGKVPVGTAVGDMRQIGGVPNQGYTNGEYRVGQNADR